jgi:SAM-dependent methyltransferase
LKFSTPFKAGDALFYNLAHPSHVYPKNRWEYDYAISVIRSKMDKEFSLLEIGAGSGVFLRKIIDCGVPANKLLAIEFDDGASQSIGSIGVDCLKVDIRKTALLSDKKFSAVAMFQVFEHLDDLDSFLMSVKNVLRDHGLIIVSVPNSERTEFLEGTLGFIDMPPNHLTTWNHQSLKILFARHNLRMKHYEIEKANFFSFAYQLIYYSILTRRQIGTKLEKKLFGIKARGLRIFFFAMFAIPHFILKIPILLQFSTKFGGSQLAIFEKC